MTTTGDITQEVIDHTARLKIKNGKKYVQRLRTHGRLPAAREEKVRSAKARGPRGDAEQDIYRNIKKLNKCRLCQRVRNRVRNDESVDARSILHGLRRCNEGLTLTSQVG